MALTFSPHNYWIVKRWILFCFCLLSYPIYAQDLSQIGKGKAFSYNGSISANTVFGSAGSGRSPFSYYLSGNLTTSVYGIGMPLSFNFTDNKFGYAQPFKYNRLSLQPSYKWVKLYIGDASMSFSPYSLNGYMFTGGGIQLTPKGPWEISVMAGRFLKAVEYDSTQTSAVPSYHRFGYGSKIGYKTNNYQLGFTVFKAKDQANSLLDPIPSDKNIYPHENVVVTFNGLLNFLKNMNFSWEYAVSGLTRNLMAENDNGKKRNLLGNFIDQNTTTQYFSAYKIAFTYSQGKVSAGMGYERIDPNYQTLGAYYMNNDLENVTVNLGLVLLKGNLNIQASGGLQRNNLDNAAASEMLRTVANVNVNYKAGQKLTITGNYSNFTSFMHLKSQFDYINATSPYQNLDTLHYTQLSHNANLNLIYMLRSDKDVQKNLSFMLALMDAADKQGNIVLKGNGSRFYNSFVGYSHQVVPINFVVETSVNTSYSSLGGIPTTTIGPVCSVQKSWFKNIFRTGLSCAWNKSFANGTGNTSVLNLRLNGSYTLKKRHTFTLNGTHQSVSTKDNGAKNIQTIILGYNYSFGSKKDEK
jgi:hypothetical protein